MKFKHKPREMVFETDRGVPFAVRYDYDPGEEQWFDARAGVGSPGHPASVEVTEISFSEYERDWGAPHLFPQVDVADVEQRIMEIIDEEAEAFFAELADRAEAA